MPTGALTEYIDVAQVALYVFWAFFAALILYLRREDKREGYPLESEGSDRVPVQGYPPLPRAKVFQLPDGDTYEAPGDRSDDRPIAGAPVAAWPGAPLEPTGDPMLDGMGPAAWAERVDHPETTIHGKPRIVPMRVADGFSVAPGDPDPRGMTVLGADRRVGGVVTDIWVDLAEPQIRYLELEVRGAAGRPAKGGAAPSTPGSVDAGAAATPEAEAKGEAEATPTEGAEAEATQETEDAPKQKAESAAKSKADAGPTQETEDAPKQKEKAEAAPKQEPEAAPTQPAATAASAPGGSVLLPIALARIDGRRRRVEVEAILGQQFAAVPRTRSDDQVTQLEEDRICAYYGGGYLYAEPSRREALL